MQLPALLAEVLQPAHFFVGPGEVLDWDHVARQEISWEIFRGQLLGPTQTRERRGFEMWNVYRLEAGRRSDEPLLSLKLDAEAGLVHVTRAIHCYAWEGYDAGGNVFLSRETQRWVNELVGTVDLKSFSDAEALRAELSGLLF